MESSVFRIHFMISFLGNLVYIIIVYFLWKAIFDSTSNETIHGMTFKSTFIYLTLASAIFTVFKTFTDWQMSRSIVDGSVALSFVKPIDYQLLIFFNQFGDVIFGFFLIFLPTCLVVAFAASGTIVFGINILFFMITLFMGMMLNFIFDFIIGTLALYTESIWGISITKEVIVLLLSGAVIPLPFFPGTIRGIVELLPFQAVYNMPLQVLINKSYGISDYIRFIGFQLIWLFILFALSRLFFKKASKVITVNGG